MVDLTGAPRSLGSVVVRSFTVSMSRYFLSSLQKLVFHDPFIGAEFVD
jgi:hypothetical protein